MTNSNKGCQHNRFKHGYAGTSTYRTWSAIKRRCYKEKSKSYKDYGGRGIKLCERWHVFENFLSDMGERPSIKLTIERLDGNKDYCPGNCIWADRTAQSRNRRYVKFTPATIELFRQDRAAGMRLDKLAAKYGCSLTHASRIARNLSWESPDAEPLPVPKRGKFSDEQASVVFGLISSGLSQSKVAARFGVHQSSVSNLLKREYAKRGVMLQEAVQ